jgi:hypothetical protein
MVSRTKKLLAEYPNCVFCGGREPATSRDHQPPKIYFREKAFPHGYDEFSACEKCNNGFSAVEHLTAYFVRICDADNDAYSEEDTERLFSYIRNNFPDLKPREFSWANDVRRTLRNMGKRKPSDTLSYDIPVVLFDYNIVKICEPSFRKITKALYFKHMKKIAPVEGAVQTIVEFNISMSDRYLENKFADILSKPVNTVPHKRTPAKNFRYKWDYNESQRVFGCLMEFGSACHVMGAVVEDQSLVKHQTRHPWQSVIEGAPDAKALLEDNRLGELS